MLVPSTSPKLLVTLVLAWAALTVSTLPARAETVFWDLETLLRDFFQTADRVTYAEVVLTDAEREVLQDRLGYAPERQAWTIFVALAAGGVVGYAVVDEELGQHQPITFGVKLTPEGVVERVEVMVYREAYGDEVRDPRFLAQFSGRSWQDPMRIDREIAAISGATISSRALSRGARRVAAVMQLLVEGRGRLTH